MSIEHWKVTAIVGLAALVCVSTADAATPRERRQQRRLRRCCPTQVTQTWRNGEGPQQPTVPHSSKPDRWFDGKSLAGWKVAEEAMFKKHGKVAVRNGRIELAAGEPATGVVWTGEAPRNNYEVTLDAMRTAGSDFFCGLTFPIDKRYCTLIVGGWGGELIGLSNVDSDPANENDTSNYLEMENDRWYRIRLRVTEQRIDVWIDNEHLIQLDTEGHKFDIWWEQEPMRPFGIATWYTGAALRNIRMRRLAVTKQ